MSVVVVVTGKGNWGDLHCPLFVSLIINFVVPALGIGVGIPLGETDLDVMRGLFRAWRTEVVKGERSVLG